MADSGDLSDEDIERIVREFARQSQEEKKRNLASKSSFMQFLENAGLMYLIRKIGDVLDWLLQIFF